jgi:hypothetical protein
MRKPWTTCGKPWENIRKYMNIYHDIPWKDGDGDDWHVLILEVNTGEVFTHHVLSSNKWYWTGPEIDSDHRCFGK